MTSADRTPGPLPLPNGGPEAAAIVVAGFDQIKPEHIRGRENFIPVTVQALIDRLSDPRSWPRGEAGKARLFFRYLEHWRRQQYNADLQRVLKAYEPFSPDSDLLQTRKYTVAERRALQTRLLRDIETILKHANYVRIDPADIKLMLTKDSHYGLDLNIDFGAFDECLIYYRGASSRKDQRRNYRKFMRKEEFDVPIFQRLFILFKLKPFDLRVREVMADQKLTRKEAEKLVKKLRGVLPPEVLEDNIYMKLFRNIPRSDIEMVFPNPQVRFRLFDKIKLGVTASGGLGMGAVGAAGKLALFASNPVAAAGAVVGLGGIAARQAVNFMNQKQRYMVVLARNLYFHAMADNRGVLVKLADRAAEEDVKEDMLLYAVLAKEQARDEDLNAIDVAIENYLATEFGLTVDFDLKEALGRITDDGLVKRTSDGRITALHPREGAAVLDEKWDKILDRLSEDDDPGEGREFEGDPRGKSA
ncbi:MAG: TMEM143 family protein [Hyphomicrobium sp.]